MTDEIRDSLAEAVRLYERYGLTASHSDAGPWINGARAALAATHADYEHGYADGIEWATVYGAATPAVGLEAMAEIVHNARWPADRQMDITPFADEDRNGREYCFRIARAVLAAKPASHAAEGGEDLRQTLTNWFNSLPIDFLRDPKKCNAEFAMLMRCIPAAQPASPQPAHHAAATPAMRDALMEIAGKNDLSSVSDGELVSDGYLASAACNALHECEMIARTALAAAPASPLRGMGLIEECARIVENWSLPTIQTDSIWLVDKAGIAAEIRALAATSEQPATGRELLDAALKHIDFDNIDPNTLTIAELRRAI